jgi:hypothetical protein
MAAEWTTVTPRVNLEAEFWEIANDFGDPLELLREAISNAIDAKATHIRIHFFVEEIEGVRTLVIELQDDGSGMSADVLAQDFWGLGFSRSREDKDKIGEKGHGTKIYLRSERVIVKTQTEADATESICERPMRALATRQSHQPRIRPIAKFQERPGTFIRIEDYNKSERSTFVQEIVKDYLLGLRRSAQSRRFSESTSSLILRFFSSAWARTTSRRYPLAMSSRSPTQTYKSYSTLSPQRQATGIAKDMLRKEASRNCPT